MLSNREKYLNVLCQLKDSVSKIIAELGFEEISNKLILFCENQDDDLYKNIQPCRDICFSILNCCENIIKHNSIERNNITTRLLELNNSGFQYPSELVNFARSLIQKKTSNFEYFINNASNKFCKPIIGSFWEENNTLIEKFDEEYFEKEFRSIEVLLTINKNFSDCFFNNTSASLKKYSDSICKEFNNQIEAVINELNIFLNKKNVSYFKIHSKDYKDIISTKEILKSVLRIDTPYQGSYPKANFRSVIIHVRSYSIMLVMILSMLGLNSQIRKPENASIANAFYIVSVALMVFGILLTYVKMQDAKSEKIEDEIKKVKEKLNIEAKRIVTEFVNELRSFLLSNFRIITADIYNNFDVLVKNMESEKQSLNQKLKTLNEEDEGINKLIKIANTQLSEINNLILQPNSN